MNSKWRCFYVCLITLVMSGGIINMFLDTRNFDAKEIRIFYLSGRNLGWQMEPELSEPERATEGALKSVITVPVLKTKSIKVQGSEVEIRIWTPPRVTRSRVQRLTDIVADMPKEICFKGCKIHVARNQTEIEGADAVVFFMFTRGYTRKELPKRANWNQIWIFNQHEPPAYYSPQRHHNHIFNFTMTYRHDSDIYQPYYRKFLLDKQLNKSEPIYIANGTNLEDWINGKTDFATAVISRCKSKSKRIEILKQMQASGISIDIFGKCGKKNVCKNLIGCKKWWDDVSRRYRFYLAFENSLCSDYVTEKFGRSLELGMVPIVLGRANYLEIAPPGSFIDVRDFSSPEELSKYLQHLANHPKEYAKFFEWRRYFGFQYNTDNFCEVCRKLKEQKRAFQVNAKIHKKDPTYNMIYNNLIGWWRNEPGKPGQPACIPPEKMGLRSFFK